MTMIPNSTGPWYKTRSGILFLSLLGLFFVALLSFGALILYYTIQIDQGNGAQIEANLRTTSQKFSMSLGGTKTAAVAPTALKDAESLVHTYTPTKGVKGAPVTIVVFIDFECPFCREAYQTLQDVTKTYEPVTRIIFKHFPLASLHPNALNASSAAQCAADQGAFWSYYDLLFQKQVLATSALMADANELHLDLATFESCYDKELHDAEIERDLGEGASLGVRGTPTFFINGVKYEGALSRAQWDTIIVAQLKKSNR